MSANDYERRHAKRYALSLEALKPHLTTTLTYFLASVAFWLAFASMPARAHAWSASERRPSGPTWR